MKFCFYLIIGLALGLSGTTAAQTQLQLSTVYHADNHNGAVLIFAENHGFVPYTILLRARLSRMHCKDSLPARFIVFPSKQPTVITTFTYDPATVYSYQYDVSGQYGIYTSHAPDSSYVYDLPFRKTTPVEQHFFNERRKRRMHHHYFFNLPENTPIRAAREGIVANLRQDLPTAKGSASNYIVLFHEDGTYAEYTNFNQNSAAFQIGQRVAKGEIICYASGLKRHWFRFGVAHPGPVIPQEIPVIFRSGN